MELEQLLHELFPAALRVSKAVSPELSSLSDEELIRRAHSTRNGERFLRLWNGVLKMAATGAVPMPHCAVFWLTGAEATRSGLTGYSFVQE